MKITIQTIKNEKVEVEVDPELKIEELKNIYKEKLDVDKKINFIHKGKILKDDQTIKSYNINDGDFIVAMVLKKRKKKEQPQSISSSSISSSNISSSSISSSVSSSMTSDTASSQPAGLLQDIKSEISSIIGPPTDGADREIKSRINMEDFGQFMSILSRNPQFLPLAMQLIRNPNGISVDMPELINDTPDETIQIDGVDEKLEQLGNMGFTDNTINIAVLQQTDGNVEEAINILLSMT